jgi:hypothetical protein
MPTRKGMSSISAIARAQVHFARLVGIDNLSTENLNNITPKMKQGSWRGNHREKYSAETPSADAGKR